MATGAEVERGVVGSSEAEKPVVSPPHDEAKSLAKLETATAAENISSKGFPDKDVALTKLQEDKTHTFIKAWEENEKAKVDNKAQKKLAEVDSWENTKKASIEYQLKKYEEQLEKKKAEYAEKMKNKMAEIHRKAEEKRAMVEVQRGESKLKTEEAAANYRATGQLSKKGGFGCFGA